MLAISNKKVFQKIVKNQKGEKFLVTFTLSENVLNPQIQVVSVLPYSETVLCLENKEIKKVKISDKIIYSYVSPFIFNLNNFFNSQPTRAPSNI